MISRRLIVIAAAGAWALLAARDAAPESHFIAKQYSRCSTCHYKPTGGGLLTPYGRALSKQEISTWGRTPEGAEPTGGLREEEFLFGVLSRWLEDAPIDLGIDLRPSRLEMDLGGRESERNFWMRADLEVAVRAGGWTGYAELGRYPSANPELISREHWVGYAWDNGTAIRAGRFLPPFGLNATDHTSYNRRTIGFDQDDQIYGVAFSDSGERHLFEAFIGPGRAESLYDDDGSASWTGGGRVQLEFGPKNQLVFSGLFRAPNDFQPQQWLGSVAWGFAPTHRLTFWSELDSRAQTGWKGTPEYVLYNRTSFEVYRGVWLHFAPQLNTELANISGGTSRLQVGAQFLPRPHWDFNVVWTRERDRRSGFVVKTLVWQLHMYL